MLFRSGVIILAILAVNAVALTACAADVPSAHVAARLAGNSLDVRNLDNFDWPDVQIAINGDWKTQVGVIPAMKNVMVSLADFTDNSGYPFVVGVQKVKKICFEMDLDRDGFRESKTCRDY